jgi:glycosyltransferase involved in cell wall biosynthesis
METGSMEINYAAFIMTYKRPAILQDTIKALMSQSIPPDQILIVDNDPDQSAINIIENLSNLNLRYFSVGYNSGPAGAAYWGCKLLYEEGWEWILWVDDDDPPVFPNMIERIFDIKNRYPNPEKIGIMGAVGVHFDSKRAKSNRLKNTKLYGIHEVDNIAGNQFPIIHRHVFQAGIFPNPELFFGFEELEFNLRVKEKGFKILVAGELIKDLREFWNRANHSRKLLGIQGSKSLWRQYYSVRNIIYILKYHKVNVFWIIKYTVKNLIKAFVSLRFGITHCLNYRRLTIMGIWDGYKRKLGKREL